MGNHSLAGKIQHLGVVTQNNVRPRTGLDVIGPGTTHNDVVARADPDGVVTALLRLGGCKSDQDAIGIPVDDAVVTQHDIVAVAGGVGRQGVDKVAKQSAEHDVGRRATTGQDGIDTPGAGEQQLVVTGLHLRQHTGGVGGHTVVTQQDIGVHVADQQISAKTAEQDGRAGAAVELVVAANVDLDALRQGQRRETLDRVGKCLGAAVAEDQGRQVATGDGRRVDGVVARVSMQHQQPRAAAGPEVLHRHRVVACIGIQRGDIIHARRGNRDAVARRTGPDGNTLPE